MKEKDRNKKFEEITRRKPKAGKESRKERGKEGKLMSSTALLFPLLADFNILYRSLAQAVVLFYRILKMQLVFSIFQALLLHSVIKRD